jgi:hypothetical protein
MRHVYVSFEKQQQPTKEKKTGFLESWHYYILSITVLSLASHIIWPAFLQPCIEPAFDANLLYLRPKDHNQPVPLTS